MSGYVGYQALGLERPHDMRCSAGIDFRGRTRPDEGEKLMA